MPPQATTLDQVVGGGIKHIVTSPTKLESTTLILAFGGLDVNFNRVQSSGGFDLLASDFNHPLLLLILVTLAVVVIIVRKVYKNKTLADKWP